MKRYHVVKTGTRYEGEGYQGHSAQQCGYAGKLEFEELRDARVATVHLDEFNPVGWCVFDHTTGDCVFGHNLYAIDKDRWQPQGASND